MEFFTSPEDLAGWVRSQGSADQAARKFLEIINSDDEQDVVDTCRAIYDDKDESQDAQDILFGVLAKNNLVNIKEGKKENKIVKEAQSQRMGLYNNMELRICPKLPKRSNIISTWNCREHCLDSMVLDDDPERVYCKEAIWRRHVMDKFSREFKDKEGKWVGGYLNERFQVMHDDGGNQMELANGERTRKPRPHQYSTERRLEEGRGNKTTDLTASKSNKIVKLANKCSDNDDMVYNMFHDIVEMKEAGITYEDILTKVSEHYNVPITRVASIHTIAESEMQRHNGALYSYASNGIEKISELAPGTRMLVIDTIPTKSGAQLLPNTNMVLEVVDETSGTYRLANGQNVVLANPMDVQKMVEADINEAADEVGLNEPVDEANPVSVDESGSENFPIEDV